MNKYIIRNEIGTEKCIVADSVNIDIIANKVKFWLNYNYAEYNDEYYNYVCKRDITELTLQGIVSISVIKYDKCVNGELETIYERGENSELLEEINRLKYMVCCPICDNEKCVKNTEKCDAEIWAKSKLRK